MGIQDKWNQGKVIVKDGNGGQIELSGWLRVGDGTGCVYLPGEHPFGWPEYRSGGWIKVRDGTIVDTHFAKTWEEPVDPDDPPLWGM